MSRGSKETLIAPEVELLSEDAAKEYLVSMIERLDELDEEEYFGPKGWRSFLDMGD